MYVTCIIVVIFQCYLEESDNNEANKKDEVVQASDSEDKTRDVIPIAGIKVCQLLCNAVRR